MSDNKQTFLSLDRLKQYDALIKEYINKIGLSVTNIINGTTKVGKATSADSATKAAQDGSGNVITSTYETKEGVESALAKKSDTGHIHAITDVTNLQTALDGKSDTSHTHKYAGSSSVGGAATSANKVNSSLTVKLNGGTTEDTNMFIFDGGAAKSVDITPSSIGAAASSHIHDDRYYTEIEIDSKLSGKADTSHGNHVPATQTASNNVFLRNDNTWATVTPANIGAAASSHTHTVANITDLTATASELNYMDGVTSNVQTQLDGKADDGHTHTKSEITDFPTALKNPNALTIKGNGTDLDSYDGSTAKTIDITPSSIGAAASSHIHTIANVTNLQSTLDSKASSSHSHTITADAEDDDVVVLTGTNGTNKVTYSVSHADSGVTVGTYKSVTVNAKGHITAGSNPTTLSGYGITDAYTKTQTDEKIEDAKDYTDTSIANLINGAPTTLDTLDEIAAAMNDNPDVVTALEEAIGKKSDVGHTHSAANITSGTISVDRLPTANGTTAGVTIVYPAASCTTFSSDTGTVTPLAVQKGAKMFAITRPTSSTEDAIVRYSNTTGDVQNSKIVIEDVTNTRDTSKKAQVIAIPAEGGKKMVYGYCTDQVDGTSFLGGLFSSDATEYPYSQGLAIGGSSGNLLWKGNKVIDAGCISDYANKYTHPTYTARTGKPTANQTPAFGGTATVSQMTSDATGHVTSATDRTITIPDTLSDGTGTAGLIKTTSTVTSNSGYTACPVINGVPYYKDTDTTYSLSSFGVTATAAELNALDGITATVTELNYTDGVTSNIQTQLNAKAPTSHASSATTYGIGTGSNYGHVKLSDSTSSTSAASAGIAASPKAVKSAYDLANTANTSANSAKSTATSAAAKATQALSNWTGCYIAFEDEDGNETDEPWIHWDDGT